MTEEYKSDNIEKKILEYETNEFKDAESLRIKIEEIKTLVEAKELISEMEGLILELKDRLVKAYAKK